MDFTGIDVGAIAASILAIIKAFHSDAKTKKVDEKTSGIQSDRVVSKKNYDERFAEYDVRMNNIERRLDKGDLRFSNVEKKIDENFRDLKNDFSKFGGNVKFIMGLLKGMEQNSRDKKVK